MISKVSICKYINFCCKQMLLHSLFYLIINKRNFSSFHKLFKRYFRRPSNNPALTKQAANNETK